MPPLLTASNLHKRLGRRDVLRGAALHANAGEAVALAGANGSGKTTLLRILAFLLRPDEGSVRWLGDGGRMLREEEARRRLGFLGHETMLYGEMTVEENIAFTARLYGAKKEAAESALDFWGLAPFRDFPVNALSRGLKQRASLARASVHAPDVYLLDEPSTGLDAAHGERLVSWMAEERGKGRAFLFAEHAGGFIARAATRTIRLEKGMIEEGCRISDNR